MEHFLDKACQRIKTTMIGSLSKMENNFGHLWGHFKEGPLTEQEERFADLWDYTRNSILNQGNKEIRNLKDDFLKSSHEPFLGIPMTITNKFTNRSDKKKG